MSIHSTYIYTYIHIYMYTHTYMYESQHGHSVVHLMRHDVYTHEWVILHV